MTRYIIVGLIALAVTLALYIEYINGTVDNMRLQIRAAETHMIRSIDQCENEKFEVRQEVIFNQEKELVHEENELDYTIGEHNISF